MIYAGIGPREAPIAVLESASLLAEELACHGLFLRTGAADGLDASFVEGCRRARGNFKVILPWKGYNRWVGESEVVTSKAIVLAGALRGGWIDESESKRKLLATGVAHVLGTELEEPSSFVVYWSDARLGRSGTAVGVEAAIRHQLPLFNIGAALDVAALKAFLAARGVDLKWGKGEATPKQLSLL